MQVDKKTYKDLDNIFSFDAQPTLKFDNDYAKAQEALDAHRLGSKKGWGKINLLVPNKNIDKWFELATQALQKGALVVIVSPFNPHYRYWFKYVYPWSSGIVLYKKHTVTFSGYTKPSPKTIALIVYNPAKRKTKRKNGERGANTNPYDNYCDGKFEYVTIPLVLDTEYKPEY